MRFELPKFRYTPNPVCDTRPLVGMLGFKLPAVYICSMRTGLTVVAQRVTKNKITTAVHESYVRALAETGRGTLWYIAYLTTSAPPPFTLRPLQLNLTGAGLTETLKATWRDPKPAEGSEK